jgi:hypothetical protein
MSGKKKHRWFATAMRLTCDDLKHQIAGLSAQQIDRMQDDELCRIIRNAKMRLLSGTTESRLPYKDRRTLLRMAFVARRCC